MVSKTKDANYVLLLKWASTRGWIIALLIITKIHMISS